MERVAPADVQSSMAARRTRILAYALACLSVAMAWLAHWVLAAAVSQTAPFLFFFLAIIVSAWFGGLYPGAVATLLSALLATTLFVEPTGLLVFLSGNKLFLSAAVLIIGGLISWLCESLQVARRRAEDALARRLEAESAAAASEQRFRHAIEEAPIPIVICAEDGAILSLNRAWQELTGFTVERLPNLRNWIEQATRDPGAAAAAFRRSFESEGQRVDHGELLVVTADGRELVWDISSAVLGKLGDGRRFAVGMAKDVTQRKHSEEQARLIRALLEHVNDAIEVIDPETGRFLDMNEKGYTDLGYTRQEVLHLTVPDIDPNVDADVFARQAEKLKQGESLRLDTVHRRKDGTTFPVEVSVKCVRLDRDYVVAVVRDITDRKRAEQERRRLSTAMEATVNGIIITDVKGNIEWVNPAFTRMTGYTSEESIGKNPRILKSGNQDKRFYTQLWRTIIAGNVWRGVLCNRRKDGSLYYEEMTITPVRDPQGVITHFISIKEDMSEKRHLEQQLHQSQKLEAIGRLAGGVAHDFNNLLTVISGYSEILLMKLPKDDPTRSSLKPIHEAAERAAGLTRQLLSFSRKAVFQPTVMSVNDTLHEIEKMLRRMIGEDISLTFVLDPQVNLIKADSGQIGQILMNLAVNARDAMPQGGKLTIETANVALDESYVAAHRSVKPGHYVMLAMTDTGTGMTTDVRERIFEPFFTTKGVGQGTGLGLSVVHGIVTQSGGSIEVYSEIGVGTTFKIYLPSCLDEATLQTTETEVVVKGGTETILLVEDEDAVRGIAILALQSNGYTVYAAASGKEALAHFENHAAEIALLVTDVVMPGMSGRELAQNLQARSNPIKVLYVSGYTDDAVVRHGLLQEDVAFLQKPYTPLVLARRVREVLDKR